MRAVEVTLSVVLGVVVAAFLWVSNPEANPYGPAAGGVGITIAAMITALSRGQRRARRRRR